MEKPLSVELYIAIALSELVSLFLIFRLWRSAEPLWLKTILTIVLLIPFIGPLMYFFATDNTATQRLNLRNDNLPYGEYTRRWITMRPLWKQFYKEKKEAIEKSKDKLKDDSEK